MGTSVPTYRVLSFVIRYSKTYYQNQKKKKHVAVDPTCLSGTVVETHNY